MKVLEDRLVMDMQDHEDVEWMCLEAVKDMLSNMWGDPIGPDYEEGQRESEEALEQIQAITTWEEADDMLEGVGYTTFEHMEDYVDFFHKGGWSI